MKLVIALSVINVVVSATTLAVVIVGGRKAKIKVETEIENMRTRTNKSLSKIKTVLNGIEV